MFPNTVQNYHGNKTPNKRRTCCAKVFYRYYTHIIFEIAIDHYLRSLLDERYDITTFTSGTEGDEELAKFHCRLEYL